MEIGMVLTQLLQGFQACYAQTGIPIPLAIKTKKKKHESTIKEPNYLIGQQFLTFKCSHKNGCLYLLVKTQGDPFRSMCFM